MAQLESNSERQLLGNQSDNGQAISNEGNAALGATSLKEFTAYRDAGKSVDPALMPSLTIEGLTGASDSSTLASKSTSLTPPDKATIEFEAGSNGIDQTVQSLNDAFTAIKAGGRGGDELGRTDLRAARLELEMARQHFKELARDVGAGEGAEEIKEGLRDLKRVDREIRKALRNDKATRQGPAMKHITEAISLLDPDTDSHVDKRNSKKNISGNHAFFEITQGYNIAEEAKEE